MSAYVAKIEDEKGTVRRIAFALVENETVEQVTRQIASRFNARVLSTEPMDNYLSDFFYELRSV